MIKMLEKPMNAAVCMTAVWAALALAAAPSLADDGSARCIQAALNSLGHDAGTVDGKIGNGTQRAVDRFRASTPGAPSFGLGQSNETEWCLYLADQEGVDQITLDAAAGYEAAAVVKIPIQIEPRALAKLALIDGNNVEIAATGSFQAGDSASELVAVFPYSEVKTAETICVLATSEYRILDASGAQFEASCDSQPIAFWLGVLKMQYNTAKTE